jgi:predicted MFS family arabinose efflux permease
MTKPTGWMMMRIENGEGKKKPHTTTPHTTQVFLKSSNLSSSMAIQYQEERRIDFESPTVSGLIGSDEQKLSEKNEVAPSAHTAATIALCLCTLTQSWLLISVYPYSGFMAIDLIPEVNEENAGSYAGMIASSFMIGRALSSYGWGKVADIYGRKFVLFASLGLSCFFSLLFGMTPTFGLALLWRFMLGLGNGLMGTVKTTISEIAHGNQELETRGMGIGKSAAFRVGLCVLCTRHATLSLILSDWMSLNFT